MEEYEIQEEKIEDEVEKRTPPLHAGAGQVPPASKRRGRLSKFVIRTLAVFFALFIALWGLAQYMQWKGVKNVEKTVELLEERQREDLKRAMADTFGGKTPQETLRMYIEAVEAGDYELASRYFIGAKQNFWFVELKEIENVNKLDVFINPLREILVSFGGEYSEDGDSFFTYEPVGIDFKKYPNGVWKIIEI